jgi:hypothetical protein
VSLRGFGALGVVFVLAFVLPTVTLTMSLMHVNQLTCPVSSDHA